MLNCLQEWGVPPRWSQPSWEWGGAPQTRGQPHTMQHRGWGRHDPGGVCVLCVCMCVCMCVCVCVCVCDGRERGMIHIDNIFKQLFVHTFDRTNRSLERCLGSLTVERRKAESKLGGGKTELAKKLEGRHGKDGAGWGWWGEERKEEWNLSKETNEFLFGMQASCAPTAQHSRGYSSLVWPKFLPGPQYKYLSPEQNTISQQQSYTTDKIQSTTKRGIRGNWATNDTGSKFQQESNYTRKWVSEWVRGTSKEVYRSYEIYVCTWVVHDMKE